MTDDLWFGFWNLFVILDFVFWLLFVICDLFFGIYLSFVICFLDFVCHCPLKRSIT